jgi:hypothetical protein
MNDSSVVDPAAARTPHPRRLRWLFPACLGAWAYLCHAVAILLFADALPIADQWDSEGYLLLKPWLDGDFHLSQLIANHNEHRILFKRILDLVAFALNDGWWDNRVLALFNATVYAAAIAFLAAVVLGLTRGLTRLALVALVALLPLAAVSIDNTIWAFQSPFFFSSLFAYSAIFLVARDRASARGSLFALLLGIGAILTLGSGFLLPWVIGAILAARALLHDERANRAWLLAGAAFVIGVAGYVAMPSLPYHEPFKAQNLLEFAQTLNRVLAWPLSQFPVGWLPLAVWLFTSVRERRRPTAADWFFLGLAVWVGLQAAAIAYGRGHATPVVPSRYTEFLLAGIVANVYFCGELVARAMRSTHARLAAPLPALAVVATLVALAYQCALAIYPLEHRLRVWQAGRPLIEGMLAGLPVAPDHVALPYPHRDKLAMFLADPTMRRLLGVEDGRLPKPCDASRIGPLSRAVCRLERGIGKRALPEFEPAPAAPEATAQARCNLDFVDSGPEQGVLSRVLPSRFFGWIGPGRRPFDAARRQGVLRLEGDAGRFDIPLGTPIARADIADFFGSADYAWAGFDQMVSAVGLPAGEYAVALLLPGHAPCRATQRLRMP